MLAAQHSDPALLFGAAEATPGAQCPASQYRRDMELLGRECCEGPRTWGEAESCLEKKAQGKLTDVFRHLKGGGKEDSVVYLEARSSQCTLEARGQRC